MGVEHDEQGDAPEIEGAHEAGGSAAAGEAASGGGTGDGGSSGGGAARLAAPLAAAVVLVAALGLATLFAGDDGSDVAGSTGTAARAEAGAEPSSDDSTTTTMEPVTTTTAATTTSTAPSTTAAPPTTSAAPTTVAPAAAPPTTAVRPEPTDTADPVRHAVIRQGVVYLRGSIPSRAAADEIIAKASTVVGPGNVVDEYVIDPAAPLVSSAPLYVEDRILFATNSSEIQPDFLPLLQLGISLLTQYPSVTLSVIGHTDAVGSAEYNQALSQRRVDAVLRWFTDRGVDPSQLVGEARGLSDPLVPADPGQAEARNRRVEFIITGLLED